MEYDEAHMAWHGTYGTAPSQLKSRINNTVKAALKVTGQNDYPSLQHVLRESCCHTQRSEGPATHSVL